jgi:hypothetical protein
MRRNALLQQSARPASVADTPVCSEVVDVNDLAAGLDDRTTAYVLKTRKPFGSARQAAGQLAGVLVLAAAGSRAVDPGHPMLGLAALAIEEAQDELRSCAPPPRGRHHHRHLLQAIRNIGEAVDRTRQRRTIGGEDVGTLLALLRSGWQELHRASATLPGFEIVAFDQACCAIHGVKKER